MEGFDPAMRAWSSFMHAKAEIHRTIGTQIHERGLSGSQLGILRVLAESSAQGLKLNEISQRLSVTPGNLTGLVDRLEEAGYLRRAPHPEDRRVTLAVLTSAGRKLFEQIHPAHAARVAHLMSALSASEQELLAELLGRLAARAAAMREGEQG